MINDEVSNVVPFPGDYVGSYTNDSIPVSNVFKGIEDNDLETVIVLGWDQEGNEYFASSTPNAMEILWLLERLKSRILESNEQ